MLHPRHTRSGLMAPLKLSPGKNAKPSETPDDARPYQVLGDLATKQCGDNGCQGLFLEIVTARCIVRYSSESRSGRHLFAAKGQELGSPCAFWLQEYQTTPRAVTFSRRRQALTPVVTTLLGGEVAQNLVRHGICRGMSRKAALS